MEALSNAFTSPFGYVFVAVRIPVETFFRDYSIVSNISSTKETRIGFLISRVPDKTARRSGARVEALDEAIGLICHAMMSDVPYKRAMLRSLIKRFGTLHAVESRLTKYMTIQLFTVPNFAEEFISLGVVSTILNRLSQVLRAASVVRTHTGIAEPREVWGSFA